jgi:hypothetical protein
MLKSLYLLAALAPTICFAGAPNVFIDALNNGTASVEILDTPNLAKMVAELNKTRSDGPLVMVAQRITRFENQPRCGRVAFIITQPSSNSAWPQMGGQLNICQDGLPPWQICANDPSVFVPPGHQCRDGSSPINTAEVQHSIDAAVASGSFSPEAPIAPKSEIKGISK